MQRRRTITHAVNVVDENEFSKKKYVWIPNDEGSYDLAKLKKAVNDQQIEVEVESTNQLVILNYDMCEPVNPPKFDHAEDMADLTRLNIPSVLHLLKKRYHQGQIYTYSGLFCVVINPYKQLPIYGNANMEKYRGRKRHEIEPHVYAVTDNAYRDMLANREDQSILCTGESGAGKTENTKKVIQHLTFIAGNKNNKNDLEKQILQSNPILEAFGNAKTVKNDNSSRFGKFIRVNFDHSGFIAGASINHYILEKARVIRQSSVGKERNFHIFYQLLAGANPSLANDLYLMSHTNYRFLSNDHITIPGVNDAEEFNNTCDAMRTMNMSEEDIKKVLMVVSAVLLLGNIKVDSDRQQQSAVFPESTSDVNKKFCELAGIDLRQFNNALLKPKIKAGIQMVTKNQKKEQVEYAIEAIAKAVYDRLFLYLVKRINHAMQLSTGNPGVNFLGILDIAGFEIFKFNSFEQLCINLTNEKLQQLFNHTLFIKEQEEYQREKIEWNHLDFGLDLVDTINLIEGTLPMPGVIALLDQACLFPNADDDYFRGLVQKEHDKTPNLLVPKGLEQGFDFAIQHYAGRVDYDVKDWLKKNMDQLNDNVISLLGSSKNSLMKELFLDAKEVSTRQRTMAIQQNMTHQPRRGGGAGKGMRRTVGSLYRDQLNKLMTTLNATEAHFVRCIIPNHMKKPGYLDDRLVIEQLKCNGVIEGIRIVRKGYPNRQTFSDFRQRYSLLCPAIANSLNSNSKMVCCDMLQFLELKENEYRVGETKIFFKNGILAQLEERRDYKLEQVMLKIQARARGYLARKRLKNKAFQERAIKIIQKNANIYLKCRQWEWWMLFNKIKPLLAMTKHDEALKEMAEQAQSLRKEKDMLLDQSKQFKDQIENLKEELESHNAELYEAQERNTIMEEQKVGHEAQINELQEACQILKERIFTEETLQQRCRDDLQDANKTIDAMNNDLRGAMLVKERLQNDKAQLDSQLKQKEAELEAQTLQADKLQKQKAELQNRLQKFEEDGNKRDGQAKQAIKAKQRLENDLADVNDALDQAKQQNQELVMHKKMALNEVNELKRKLAAAEQKIRDLESANQRLSREISEIKSQLAESQKSSSTLNSQMNKMESDIEILEEEKSAAERERDRFAHKVKNLEQENNELKETIYDERTGINEVETRLKAENERVKEENSQQLAAFQQETQNLMENKNKLLLEKKDLEDDLHNLYQKNRQDVNRHAQQVKQYEEEAEIKDAKLQQYENRNRQLEQKILTLQAENDQINELYAPCEGNIAKLRRQNEILAANVEDFEQKEADQSRTIKALQAELEDLNQNLTEVSEEKEKVTKDLRQAQQNYSQITDAYNEEKTQKEVKDDRINKLQHEQDQLKKVIEDLQIENEDSNQNKEKFKRLVLERESDIEEFERKVSNLEKAKRRVEAQRDDVQIELEEYQSQVANISNITNRYERELQQLRDQISVLNNDKDSANATARAAEQRAYQYKLEKEAFEEDLEHARNLNKRNQAEIEKLTVEAANSAEIEDLIKQRRILQDTNTELKQQIEEMTDELYEEEKRNNHLNNQLVEFQNMKEKHNREIEEVEDAANTRVQKIKAEMLEKQDEMDQAMRKAKTESAKRVQAERLLQETKLNLETTTNSLNEAGKQINILREKLSQTDEKDQKLKEREQRCEELEKLIEALRRNNTGTLEELQSQIDQLTREKRCLQGEVADQQVEIDALTRSERSAVHARNQQSERCNLLEAEIDGHILAEDEARQKAAIAEQNYNKANIDLETLKSELENSLADVMACKRKMTAMEDEHQEAIHEMARKNMQQKTNFAKEKEKIEEDKMLIKKRCDQIDRELKKLRPRCQDQENQLIEKDDRISSLETDTRRGAALQRRLKNENADLSEEIQRLKNRNQRLVVEIEEMTTTLIG